MKGEETDIDMKNDEMVYEFSPDDDPFGTDDPFELWTSEKDGNVKDLDDLCNQISKMADLEHDMKVIAAELLRSEQVYMNMLEKILNIYQRQLESPYKLQDHHPVISEKQIAHMFINTRDLLELSISFYTEMEEIVLSGGIDALVLKLPQLFSRYVDFFKMFPLYCNCFRLANRTYELLFHTNPTFRAITDVSAYCAGLTLPQLLLVPVQRVPKYLHFISLIKASGGIDDDNLTDLIDAEKGLEKISKYMNEAIKLAKAQRKVFHIQEDFFKNKLTIVAPQRFCVMYGALTRVSGPGLLKGKNKRYVFFLFSDLLISSLPVVTSSSALKEVIPLEGVSVVMGDDKGDQKFRFSVKRGGKEWVLETQDEKSREVWMGTISRYAADASEEFEKRGKVEAADAKDIEKALKQSPFEKDKSGAIVWSAEERVQEQVFGSVMKKSSEYLSALRAYKEGMPERLKEAVKWKTSLDALRSQLDISRIVNISSTQE